MLILFFRTYVREQADGTKQTSAPSIHTERLHSAHAIVGIAKKAEAGVRVENCD
jgi:hypothetical protein